jgi:hypothetical protein
MVHEQQSILIIFEPHFKIKRERAATVVCVTINHRDSIFVEHIFLERIAVVFANSCDAFIQRPAPPC